MFHKSDIFEFDRVLNTVDIPPTGHGFNVTATVEECASLCERFDLQLLTHFNISGTLKPQGKQRYVLTAKIVAEVVQTCVITLEPIENTIEAMFTLVLEAADEVPGENQEEIDLNELLDEDPPLNYTDNRINFGECAVQYFSDCLDQYPRKQNATFEATTISPNIIQEETRDNQFEILQKLKSK